MSNVCLWAVIGQKIDDIYDICPDGLPPNAKEANGWIVDENGKIVEVEDIGFDYQQELAEPITTIALLENSRHEAFEELIFLGVRIIHPNHDYFGCLAMNKLFQQHELVEMRIREVTELLKQFGLPHDNVQLFITGIEDH